MDIGEGFTRIQASREKPALESIEITTPPTKTDYIVGDLFDNTGMVVTAKYSNGSSKIVTNYTYSPKTELKITDSTITIVYTEDTISKEATQTIKVTTKQETNNGDNKVALESIEITTPPTKTNYTEGEPFDKTGMVITAKYSDGSTRIVTNYTYLPKAGLKTTDSTITIVYNEDTISKEATQRIKVTEKKDTTIAGGKLPQTGEKTEIVFIILALIGMGLAFYLRYRKMKNII